MNILIVSDSFVMREYMQIFFKCLVEDANLNIKRKLSETTKQELLQSDFILIDIHNDIIEELKVIDFVKMKNKNIKVLVTDRGKNKNTLKKVLEYGIEGYITNTIEKEEFILVVKKILSGQKSYKTDLIQSVVESKFENNIKKLTKRENEVLKEISNGLNNKEISEKLFITESTVKKHVSNILQKLNFKNRQEAIIYISNGK